MTDGVCPLACSDEARSRLTSATYLGESELDGPDCLDTGKILHALIGVGSAALADAVPYEQWNRFQRQRWRSFRETGLSAYGHYRARSCRLEINCGLWTLVRELALRDR